MNHFSFVCPVCFYNVFTFVNAGHLVLKVDHRRKCVHSKVGGDVKVLSLDETDTMAIRVVVDILQFVQNDDTLLTFLLAIWK